MIFLMSIAYIGDFFLFLSFIFRKYHKENKEIFGSRESKETLVERLRNSINQQVISSAFNNDVVNDNIDSDNGYMGDKESERNGDELKDIY